MEETGAPPFVLNGRLNQQPSSTIIDSGSPITILTIKGKCLENPKTRKKETESLGYKISAGGKMPIEENGQPITDKLRPKNNEDSRPFMGKTR